MGSKLPGEIAMVILCDHSVPFRIVCNNHCELFLSLMRIFRTQNKERRYTWLQILYVNYLSQAG
jgi:hypothetical protein